MKLPPINFMTVVPVVFFTNLIGTRFLGTWFGLAAGICATVIIVCALRLVKAQGCDAVKISYNRIDNVLAEIPGLDTTHVAVLVVVIFFTTPIFTLWLLDNLFYGMATSIMLAGAVIEVWETSAKWGRLLTERWLV